MGCFCPGGPDLTSRNLIFASSELGNTVTGVFTPVLAEHSKSFLLIDCISVGVDRMQRNFEPMRKQVEAWQRSELTDVTASRSTRNSGREQSGVFRVRLLRRSRKWIPFCSSRPQQSWENSWKHGSRNRSRLEQRSRPGPPHLKHERKALRRQNSSTKALCSEVVHAEYSDMP